MATQTPGPNNSNTSIYQREVEICSHQDSHSSFYHNFIHNSQILEIVICLSLREKKKLIVVYLYNEMLLSNKHITDYIERGKEYTDNYVGDLWWCIESWIKSMLIFHTQKKEILK